VTTSPTYSWKSAEYDENLRTDVCLGTDLNHGPHEHEAGVLTHVPWLLVLHVQYSFRTVLTDLVVTEVNSSLSCFEHFHFVTNLVFCFAVASSIFCLKISSSEFLLSCTNNEPLLWTGGLMKLTFSLLQSYRFPQW